MRTLVATLAGLACLIALAGPAPAAEPATLSLTLVTIEYEGSKIWVPGTIVVKKGTKVTLKLINNVKAEPNQHGFAIPGYNVAAIVNRGEPQTVEFTADKAGVFPFICQLHPAHVGGELVVLV
jgi:nitrosocyanin